MKIISCHQKGVTILETVLGLIILLFVATCVWSARSVLKDAKSQGKGIVSMGHLPAGQAFKSVMSLTNGDIIYNLVTKTDGVPMLVSGEPLQPGVVYISKRSETGLSTVLVKFE